MERRVALVTGAARGIGRAIAEDLATDHAVAFTHRNSDPAPVLASCPGSVALEAELSDPAAATGIIDGVLAAFGRIDVIVNNAGHVGGAPIGGADLEGNRANFAVNVEAPMAILDAALPHLQPGSAVVNISSVNARLPPVSAPAYGASKAALETWTKAAAKALGPKGIRVNAIAPGAIENPESPRSDELIALFLADTALDRLGEAGDIAAAVRFLVGNPSSFITGHVLDVDGGYRL